MEVLVFDFASVLVDHHQPAVVSMQGWFLRDEFLWELIREGESFIFMLTGFEILN